MKPTEKTLCYACAVLLKEGYDVQEIPGENKLLRSCEMCGRRTFGGKFAIKGKEKKNENQT